MRFADYDNKLYDEAGLMKYKEYFEKYIEVKKKELEQFLLRGNERIEKIKEWEVSKKL